MSMLRRCLAAFALTLAACSDSGTEPVSIDRQVDGWIEFQHVGGFEPLRVATPTPVLQLGTQVTIHVNSFAEGCYGMGPLEILSLDGTEAHVAPKDIANISYPPQPCAAGVREFPHELVIRPAANPYRLLVTGRATGHDTLVTREVLIPVQ